MLFFEFEFEFEPELATRIGTSSAHSHARRPRGQSVSQSLAATTKVAVKVAQVKAKAKVNSNANANAKWKPNSALSVSLFRPVGSLVDFVGQMRAGGVPIGKNRAPFHWLARSRARRWLALFVLKDLSAALVVVNGQLSADDEPAP